MIGSHSPGLIFMLTPTGFCARVSPADTILHDHGVDVYRITKWDVNGWNIEIHTSPLSGAPGIGYLKGRSGWDSLKLNNWRPREWWLEKKNPSCIQNLG